MGKQTKRTRMVDRVRYLSRSVVVGTIFALLMMSAWMVFSYARLSGESSARLDAALAGNIEKASEISFLSMRALRDVLKELNVSDANTIKKLLGEFTNSTTSESAFVDGTGKILYATPGIETSGKLKGEIPKDFGFQKTSVGYPFHEPGSKFSVFPVFLAVEPFGGYLYVEWRPALVGGKTVQWMGNALYTSEGLLVESNTEGMLSRLSPSELASGKMTTGKGEAFVSKLKLPDGKTDWWILTISEEGNIFKSALWNILPVLLAIPFVVFFSFLPFNRMRRGVEADMRYLGTVTDKLNTEGRVVYAKIDGRGTSLEVRALAKALDGLTRMLNEVNRGLETRAGFDRLTAIPNRTAMEEHIAVKIAKEEMFGLFFLDLDGFKPVNDNLGHDVGDMVLREVAIRLSTIFKQDKDYICRWGGDEFVICLSGDVESARKMLMERIRESLSNIDVEKLSGKKGSTRFTIGASIGVSLFPQDGIDVETLIKTADERMYEDKLSRKKRC